jgi:uncharacterized protein
VQLEMWIKKIEDYLLSKTFADGSHDLHHFRRVWSVASELCEEQTDRLIVLAACYFHDIVSYPKNHPSRAISSQHAAIKASEILTELGFPSDKISGVKHAIEAHSFSAQIEPQTNEAKIVQDADRMEALGAIGLARTFYVAGMLGSKMFDAEDPFARERNLDDKSFALDHFFVKLFKLPGTMQTEKGRRIAMDRMQVLKKFVEDLGSELR